MNIRDARRLIVEAAHRAGTGHIPSSLSCLDIIWTVYHRVMRPDDKFILSKGHAALALYAVLESKGILPHGEIMTFAQPGSRLGGHPDCQIPGVEACAGSLGHGLAIGTGIALAKRIRGEPGRVYVLVGDGECQEGSIWEAARIAAESSLDIVLLVDNNSPRQNASTISDALVGLGWDISWIDGHEHEQIYQELLGRGPLAVICQTVKGKGVKRMEQDPGAWHHRAPNDVELREMLAEL